MLEDIEFIFYDEFLQFLEIYLPRQHPSGKTQNNECFCYGGRVV